MTFQQQKHVVNFDRSSTQSCAFKLPGRLVIADLTDVRLEFAVYCLDVFLQALGVGEVLAAQVAQLFRVPKRNLKND